MAARPSDASPRPTVKANRSAWIYGAGALALLIAGMQFENNGIVLLASIALAHLGICFVFARQNLRDLSVTRHLAPPVFAGARFPSTLRLRRSQGKPGSLLTVHDRPTGRGVPRLPPSFFSAVQRLQVGDPLSLRQEGIFFRRGLMRFTHVEITSAYPLGLFTARVDLPCPGEILVYPHQLSIPPRLLPQDRFDRHGATPDIPTRGRDDFAGLREYRPGDNARWIHWKSSARVEERLLVREFDRTPILDVTVRFDAAVEKPGSRAVARFERGVQISASLVRELVTRHHSVRFLLRQRTLETYRIRAGGRGIDAFLERLALIEPVRTDELVAIDEASPQHGPHLILRPVDLRPRRSLSEILDWHAGRTPT